MKDSYLNLDEEMLYVRSTCMKTISLRFCSNRFLNCKDGGKVPGRSLLKVDVQEAMKDAGYDEEAFHRRGGVFDWSRKVVEEESLDW